jgi:hypothetical protein
LWFARFGPLLEIAAQSSEEGIPEISGSSANILIFTLADIARNPPF